LRIHQHLAGHSCKLVQKHPEQPQHLLTAAPAAAPAAAAAVAIAAAEQQQAAAAGHLQTPRWHLATALVQAAVLQLCWRKHVLLPWVPCWVLVWSRVLLEREWS
jgi:hypothetical protein